MLDCRLDVCVSDIHPQHSPIWSLRRDLRSRSTRWPQSGPIVPVRSEWPCLGHVLATVDRVAALIRLPVIFAADVTSLLGAGGATVRPQHRRFFVGVVLETVPFVLGNEDGVPRALPDIDVAEPGEA